MLLIKKYFKNDHVGSIRQTLNEAGVVKSATDYYAFGETKSSYILGGTVDKYRFTSKERDLETGLDYFGARYFDSKIGRWLSVDPMAEKYPGLSPYNYSANNPINFFDPDGKKVWSIKIVAGKGMGGYFAANGGLSFVWDDKNNAGIRWELGVGVSLGEAASFSTPTVSTTNDDDIFKLSWFDISLSGVAGISALGGWGGSLDYSLISRDWSGAFAKSTGIGVSLSAGFSGFLKIGKLNGQNIFQLMVESVKNGGNIYLFGTTLVVFDKLGNVITELDLLESGSTKGTDYSPEKFAPADKTKTNNKKSIRKDKNDNSGNGGETGYEAEFGRPPDL